MALAVCKVEQLLRLDLAGCTVVDLRTLPSMLCCCLRLEHLSFPQGCKAAPALPYHQASGIVNSPTAPCLLIRAGFPSSA